MRQPFSTSSGAAAHRRIVGQRFQLTVKLHTAHTHIPSQILHIEFRIFHPLLDKRFEAGDETLIQITDGFLLDSLVISEELPQLTAVCNKIADTRQEQLRIEWFGNIRIGTAIIALDTLFVQRAGRQQNHRDMACLQLPLQAAGSIPHHPYRASLHRR